MDRSAVRAALIEQLRPRSFKPVDDIPDSTDIYRDLGVNGWDLWEVFHWAAEAYGTDFSLVAPEDYDINEPPAMLFKRRFKAVTIGEMLDAIERGHWIVPP